MKKLLLALFIGVSLLSIQDAKAQMAAGSIAPDFTATDLNGNSWNLYSLLDSGYTVFMDISATWCGPCWSYHTGLYLDNLYNAYGPDGTNEIRVFFVEGDGTTTTADLNGTGTNTQGDWVTGTPYPILDNATIANNYQINYFPTVYMICPDRIIKEVGQLTTNAAFMAQKTADCFIATEANDAGITNSMNVLNGTLASCNSVDVAYRLCNYGTTPLTSATIDLNLNGTISNTLNWTGTLNTYESTILTFTGVSGNTGSNTATVVASNPNGSADVVAGNDSRTISIIKYAGQGSTIPAQTFAGTFPPTDWLHLTPSTSGGAFLIRSAASNGGGTGSVKADFWNATSGDVDALQLPQLDMTAVVNPIMTFDVAHAQYSTSADNLKVKVSTNCGLSWMTLYNKSGATLATTAAATAAFTPSTAAQWRKDTVNLANYATNQNVFVKFEFTSNYGNNAYVDNVNIVANTSGINTIAQQLQFEVYPNPASDRSAVDFTLTGKEDVAIFVYNNVGEAVYSRNEGTLSAGEYTFEIPTASLASGVYMVNIKTAQGSSVKKLVIK